MKPIAKTKKINGETYHREGFWNKKSVAKAKARGSRSIGYKSRIIIRRSNGRNLYVVYTSKTKRKGYKGYQRKGSR